MNRKKEKSMTSGNPMGLILGFAIPLLFGQLFQHVYSMVDTMIVGKTLGVSALAAVGATGSITFLVLGLCMGMCGGFAIPLALAFGANDEKRLHKYEGNAIVLTAIFAVILTLFTVVFCRTILLAMHTPEDIREFSFRYLVIIFAGIPFTMLYNLLSGFLRSLGDSRTPLYFLIFSSVLNVILDLAFILFLHWGVSGAAAATILSQGISGILCIVYILHAFPMLHIQKSDLHLEKDCVRYLLSMGLPMGLQFSVTAVGSIIIQTAVNGLGSAAVAAMTAAQKVDMFVQSPFAALGNTMTTYAGQNVGAAKYDRLKKGLFDACLLGCGYAVLVGFFYNTVGKYSFLLFINASETDVLAKAGQYMSIVGFFYISLALVNIVRFTIQGMGFSTFAIFAGFAEMIARGAIGLFLVPVFGFTAVCFSGPAAWICADCFLIPAFFWCLKRLRSFAS